MRLRLYYNELGEIVATSEIKIAKDVPPTGTFDVPNTKVTEVDVSDEIATSLVDLHTNYKLNLKGKEPVLEKETIKAPNLSD